ncbi:unnamed protein product [Kuraishia capsulata CBS 1993]|uniref:Uncharacterized protein n=1 Tax=Kuraishia capsulata CBS 1993 TaxID=1382522 RepID=W6MXA0_9ASCO|nr:uncharacterized protein KUCA_T00004508001 [Kuraishia capsulata CBS 1993]CDK28525.1 unnamed protein product [Kuraishia capsulata CBS 1993]
MYFSVNQSRLLSSIFNSVFIDMPPKKEKFQISPFKNHTPAFVRAKRDELNILRETPIRKMSSTLRARKLEQEQKTHEHDGGLWHSDLLRKQTGNVTSVPLKEDEAAPLHKGTPLVRKRNREVMVSGDDDSDYDNSHAEDGYDGYLSSIEGSPLRKIEISLRRSSPREGPTSSHNSSPAVRPLPGGRLYEMLETPVRPRSDSLGAKFLQRAPSLKPDDGEESFSDGDGTHFWTTDSNEKDSPERTEEPRKDEELVEGLPDTSPGQLERLTKETFERVESGSGSGRFWGSSPVFEKRFEFGDNSEETAVGVEEEKLEPVVERVVESEAEPVAEPESAVEEEPEPVADSIAKQEPVQARLESESDSKSDSEHVQEQKSVSAQASESIQESSPIQSVRQDAQIPVEPAQTPIQAAQLSEWDKSKWSKLINYVTTYQIPKDPHGLSLIDAELVHREFQCSVSDLSIRVGCVVGLIQQRQRKKRRLV